MALGWCKGCSTLRTITQGPQKWGTRECHWYPLNHWVFMHLCLIDSGKEMWDIVSVVDDLFYCNTCGKVESDNVQERLCPGIKKPL